MMATTVKPEFPSSPPNDESDPEGDEEPEVPAVSKPATRNVADILQRLKSSGALLKKPKEEHRCFTCEEDYPDWPSLEAHLITHVSLPSVVIDKLSSDDEDVPPSGDDWSDEDDDVPPQTSPQKTPQKIDISQIMKKTGISIKTPVKSEPSNSSNSASALNKLSGLGFTIKKNNTPIKQENSEPEVKNSNDIMKKLGQLGGIKLKLKSEGGSSNAFKVVNGLKDFKTSDDDDEDAEMDEEKADSEEDQIKDEIDNDDQGSADEQEEKSFDDDEDDIPLSTKKVPTAIKNIVKSKLGQTIVKPAPTAIPEATQEKPVAKAGRPAVKQTPRRGPNFPLKLPIQPTQGQDISTTSSTPERRASVSSSENVVVKQETEPENDVQSSTTPLFSGQIKTERSSPPPSDTTASSTPIITKIKTESENSVTNEGQGQPLFHNQPTSTAPPPLMPVTKTEDPTIIEINGDSNDEDDDCCVVSATPAPDVKPVIPKTETIPTVSYPMPSYSTSQPSYTSDSVLNSRLTGPSLEKQHTFNWNAPDSKPAISLLENSADDIFESLLSTKREHSSMSSDAEYVSLDTLGPQHSCQVCNTRYTSLMLLEEHKRMTGHSSSLVAPTSSTLLPYNPQSTILSSLLPVKQLAEQVGKLSTIGGSGSGFTHQQNVMINIQAYPGSGGVMGPPPAYNSYNTGQGMHTGYGQTTNNMYNPGQPMSGMPGQQMPGQFTTMPNQNYMGQQQYGQQFQPTMSSASYPGAMPQSSPQYSSASPLQNMQQAFGQTPGMGQMGPPGSSPNHPYVPASSPSGMMKPPVSSNVRIQNVQTFPPGQLVGAPGQQMPGDMSSGQMAAPGQGQMLAPGQTIGSQMPAPGPIRMAAGAMNVGPRPRMAGIRGTRPSIRPGIQVHAQLRGAKPRMPMKRPGGPGAGPMQKRRPDMLLPGKHDNEDCQVMSMQKQRDGVPMIHSVHGAKDKLNLGSQISVTKKPVNKAAQMANLLASRGINVKQKQKSRSPSPERPVPHIPNLPAGMSIKHTSKSSNFSIPEASVGGSTICKVCKKSFMNSSSLAIHMTNAHPHVRMNMFKCDECPASYPKGLQLQHHKRTFHNMQGANRELGIPVVDLSHEDNVKRLSNLGIYSFIPLANREQGGGCFGIPVISVHNMQNGMTSGLQALGADGLLSLGPLKTLPNT